MTKRKVTEDGKAAIKRGAQKTAIKKLLARLNTIDLAPLDAEILDLESRLAELRGQRSRILAMRPKEAQLGAPAGAVAEATIEQTADEPKSDRRPAGAELPAEANGDRGRARSGKQNPRTGKGRRT